MTEKRDSDDDNGREQRKRPTEDDNSDQRDSKVPRLPGKDEEKPPLTSPGHEQVGDTTNQRDGAKSKDVNKDIESEDTGTKDMGSRGNEPDVEYETNGERKPKRQKVAGEEGNKAAEGAGASAETAADTDRDAKEGEDKKEGNERENARKDDSESDDGDADDSGATDDDEDDDGDSLGNVVVILEDDGRGGVRVRDIFFDEPPYEDSDEGSEDDSEGSATNDELLAMLEELLGIEDTEEEEGEESHVERPASEGESRGEREDAEDDKEGRVKTAEEKREDEKRDGEAAKGRSQEEDADMKQEEEDEEEHDGSEDHVTLHVTFNKQCHDIELPLSAKMSRLKKAITEKTGIPPAMQKLCYKGATQADDGRSLRDCGLSADSKILMVGSTAQDLDAVKKLKPTRSSLTSPLPKKVPFCRQEKHKAIIDDGVPDDAFPGILNVHDDLPNGPIAGMLNSQKQKVRLTFKLEEDQFWISTRETTDKYSLDEVAAVVSQPIEGHEEYHIMLILTGPVAAGGVWLYWVPAQYVRAIRRAMSPPG